MRSLQNDIVSQDERADGSHAQILSRSDEKRKLKKGRGEGPVRV